MGESYQNNWYYDQRYDSQSTKSVKCFVYNVVLFVFIALIALVLFSCTTTKYIPVETVRTEYVNKTDTFIQKDSVFYHDSVYIHSKGDTVWFEKWHTKYKDKIVTKIVIDSFIKTDSIQVPYPIKKKLTKWQQVKMDAGGLAIGACLLFIVIIIVGLVMKLRKMKILS